MHGQEFVDANKLQSGIYYVTRPFLENEDMTMEKVVERAKNLFDNFPGAICPMEKESEYLNNLFLCRVADIELEVKN